MEIKTALDGIEVCDNLRKELSQIRYNPDLQKMLKNISNMVTDISKLEVECRRVHSRMVLETPLKKVNESVDHLQKLILMAKLMD